jgi:hypothetical protein
MMEKLETMSGAPKEFKKTREGRRQKSPNN